MKMTYSMEALELQKKDALIVFAQAGEVLLGSANRSLKKLITEYIKTADFKGESGQVAVFPTFGKFPAGNMILSGLGAPKDFHRALLEQAAAAAVRAGRKAGLKTFAISACSRVKSVSDSDYRVIAGRGACWGTYAFERFMTAAKKQTAPTLAFAGQCPDTAAVRADLKTAAAQGTALLGTADLANLPGNEAAPAAIADWARKMASANKLSCQILGKSELAKKGCGGILGVAQGSAQDAKMIILKHAGTDKKARPIILVGKTVTFDSGGISLKPGKGMGWMRYDKCGGMAVLAAMQMIARMNLRVPVVGILGAAENMPGANAMRPGDIIKARNGKTIEVLNTDAEGRLVLADALSLAVEMKPSAIVDLATLTGAVIVALGSAASAVIGDDQLAKEPTKAGADAGERLWQLPLWKEYSDEMKSDFADISNIGKTGGAGTATAGAFLRAFVPEEIPWAHIDIAGTAWLESGKPYQGPGATLFGARLLAQWVASK
ncbi:MAG: leucyl aminopeptidase [Kiritimatiellales bacterium]|nr:leucyl aminopeptidase [Kiritimatiellales bacterium]